MKISDVESTKALANAGEAEARILPKDRPRGAARVSQQGKRELSPLEKGMAVAQNVLADIPDTRDEIVSEIKERIEKGEYNVSGQEIAEMMLRRRAADRIR